jgi:hypothetical protein
MEDELVDYGGYKLDKRSDHLKDILIDLELKRLDLFDAHRLIMDLFNCTPRTVL